MCFCKLGVMAPLLKGLFERLLRIHGSELRKTVTGK